MYIVKKRRSPWDFLNFLIQATLLLVGLCVRSMTSAPRNYQVRSYSKMKKFLSTFAALALVLSASYSFAQDQDVQPAAEPAEQVEMAVAEADVLAAPEAVEADEVAPSACGAVEFDCAPVYQATPFCFRPCWNLRAYRASRFCAPAACDVVEPCDPVAPCDAVEIAPIETVETVAPCAPVCAPCPTVCKPRCFPKVRPICRPAVCKPVVRPVCCPVVCKPVVRRVCRPAFCRPLCCPRATVAPCAPVSVPACAPVACCG